MSEVRTGPEGSGDAYEFAHTEFDQHELLTFDWGSYGPNSRYTLAGAIGLLAAWVIMEPTWLMPESTIPGVEPRRIPYYGVFLIGLIAGLLAGLMLGVAEALSCASRREATRAIVISALFGAGGGVVGLTIGNRFYATLSSAADAVGFLSFLLLLIGRGLRLGADRRVHRDLARRSDRQPQEDDQRRGRRVHRRWLSAARCSRYWFG